MTDLCIECGKRPPHARNLCSSCYSSARRSGRWGSDIGDHLALTDGRWVSDRYGIQRWVVA